VPPNTLNIHPSDASAPPQEPIWGKQRREISGKIPYLARETLFSLEIDRQAKNPLSTNDSGP
jgi:hypothetical protein